MHRTAHRHRIPRHDSDHSTTAASKQVAVNLLPTKQTLFGPVAKGLIGSGCTRWDRPSQTILELYPLLYLPISTLGVQCSIVYPLCSTLARGTVQYCVSAVQYQVL